MAQNAARSLEGEQMQQLPERVLRSVPSDPSGGHAGEVVAEILSDGTVRPKGTLGPVEGEPEWSRGQVSGDGWVLWWERRRLSA